MSVNSSADGERGALSGYRWQYDHAAARVYDAILRDELVELQLTNSNAGIFDDLVLVRKNRVECFQFRSGESGGNLTFNKLAGPGRKSCEFRKPSLIGQLAASWKALRDQFDGLTVHLVTKSPLSIHDRLGKIDDPNRPSPRHFRAFCGQVLEPIAFGTLPLDRIPDGWKFDLERFEKSSGLARSEFEGFVKSLRIEADVGSAVPVQRSIDRIDVIGLSDALLRSASFGSGTVRLDASAVLELMGWEGRLRLQSRHEFPVDIDTYSPLAGAIQELQQCLGKCSSGYVAIVGPPGSGKSTLLSQALSSSSDRIIRYYAFIPGIAFTRPRTSATGFLHDLVLMLKRAGINSARRELLANDVDGLRTQLQELLDDASAEFRRTGKRTLIVVDGLDHVSRDFRGFEGLLPELPLPHGIPDGVLIVLGSRTLRPLSAYIRQQLEERETVVDLRPHRLPRPSVIEICERAPATAGLTPALHAKIARLCDGYPLALGYILNRIRDADPSRAEEVLGSTPAYAGDVEGEYKALWDELADDREVSKLLAICSRLRIGFKTEWFHDWVSDSAIERFRRELLYLFRFHLDGWQFFHDSFKQFAMDNTAVGDDRKPDAIVDRRIHEEIVGLCAASRETNLRSEGFYHSVRAGKVKEALSLATQPRFRHEFKAFRSPSLIQEDLDTALSLAVDFIDVKSILRLTFATAELRSRIEALEEFSMPGLLVDAGMIDEAISFVGPTGLGNSPTDAFMICAKLGKANEPDGRRIFELIEHSGFGHDSNSSSRQRDDELGVAWVQAAATFRSVPSVFAKIQDWLENSDQFQRLSEHTLQEKWHRFEVVVQELIDILAGERDISGLQHVHDQIANLHAAILHNGINLELDADSDRRFDLQQGFVATLIDLISGIEIALIDVSDSREEQTELLNSIENDVLHGPTFEKTRLTAAEKLAAYGRNESAAKLLNSLNYGSTFDGSDLSLGHESNPLEIRFRYWKLKWLLFEKGIVNKPVMPASIDPSAKKLENAPQPSQFVLRSFVFAQMNKAVFELGRLASVAEIRKTFSAEDPLETLESILNSFPAPSSINEPIVRWALRSRHPELIGLMLRTAWRIGVPIFDQLKLKLMGRFANDPDNWPYSVQVQVADHLRISTEDHAWYKRCLSGYENAIVGEDVSSKLDVYCQLVAGYRRMGDLQSAVSLVHKVQSASFGVGYRNDYQFDVWVDWLGAAMESDPDEWLFAEADWLLQLLAAVSPMTEGATRSAASKLPGTIGRFDPVIGVRSFEYLVRSGAVSHFNALAQLLTSLVEQSDGINPSSVTLAANITAELITPCSNGSHPNLARGVIEIAKQVMGDQYPALRLSMLERIHRYAMPSLRSNWLVGTGFSLENHVESKDRDENSDSDAFDALLLLDGTKLSVDEVSRRVKTVSDIIEWRRIESNESHYLWGRILDGRSFSSEEIDRLVEDFSGDRHEHPEYLAAIAEAAERNGSIEVALKLANLIIEDASANTWSREYNSGSKRAAYIVGRHGKEQQRRLACSKFVRLIQSTTWWPNLLLAELRGIAGALDPELTAADLWPEVREYLNGMAESLDFYDARTIADRGVNWWLRNQSVLGDSPNEIEESTVETALAEIAVRHLSHPALMVHEAASTCVVESLAAGDKFVANSLLRFALTAGNDDLLERAGKCLAALELRGTTIESEPLNSLRNLLANHPNQVIRNLISRDDQPLLRSLPPKYKLELPPGEMTDEWGEIESLFPFENQYEELAGFGGIDYDNVCRIAGQLANEELKRIPNEKAIRESLNQSNVRLPFVKPSLAASRSAFGRVLADAKVAGLTDQIERRDYKAFRAFDVGLVGMRPKRRPNTLPCAPQIDRYKLDDSWTEEIRTRLQEYVSASSQQGQQLIGAKYRMRMFDGRELAEQLECGATLGRTSNAPQTIFSKRQAMYLNELCDETAAFVPRIGAPILISNVAPTFCQLDAWWIGMNPGIAARLNWVPVPSEPGSWRTDSGQLAVKSTRWTDGKFGLRRLSVGDWQSEGYAIALTEAGMGELTSMFGQFSIHYNLERCIGEDCLFENPSMATQSLPMGS